MNDKRDSLKNDIQKINNRLDKMQHRLEGAKARNDRTAISQLEHEISLAAKKRDSLKKQQTHKLGNQAGNIKAMAFSRPLTKAEQSDMGKLKKSVKGLVVVHPMTALGKEMGLEVVTGFAPKTF